MKLRTKITLFFGIFFLTITLAVVVFVQYVVGDTFKKQKINDFRIIAEQSEGTYFAFLEGMKTRAFDWTSDTDIQGIAKKILDTGAGTPERARSAKEFAVYLNERKMPYDKTVFLVDLLDKNGIVIASTRPERIGTDELNEEVKIKAHHFSKTIVSKFGEVFMSGIIFEEDETLEPMIHATVRLFTFDKNGVPEPLPAVLLVHFVNTKHITRALGVGNMAESSATGRSTSNAFLESYKTSDIYLVNSNRIMVTPSRYMQNINLHQKVDTFPVRECLENGREISEEYDNYQGIHVLGASMCFKEDGLVLLVEIQKDEVYTPLDNLIRLTVAGGLTIFVFGILLAIFFVRRPLAHINTIVAGAKRVTDGDLDASVTVHTKDEIGYLAAMFNMMIISVREARKDLEASKSEIEEKAKLLEQDVVVHKKQEKFLEESKKATMNLLEDSWKAKEQIEEEGLKLQTILASIGDGLILIDPKYNIALVNAKVLEMFAMSHDELVGRDLRTIVKFYKNKAELEPGAWPTEEVFLSKKPVTTTLEDNFSLTTSAHTNALPVELSIAPLGGKFAGAVIILRDATADRELDEAKSGFISVASHQLRTPLTSIRWYAEMLLSGDVGALNDAQKDFMVEVHSGAERLYQTVDLLLGISRVESGKVKADRTPIDLGEFTSGITKELASQIDEKNLELIVNPPARDAVVVWLDALTLRQVILNLVSNAIRYTNEKGLIEIKWWVSDDGREAVYMVHDNGIGIPEAQRARIFSKFFRAENARAQVPDGSGLGLALVKNLVESWGGKVWFESFPGQGSTFFFTVPFFTKVADPAEHAKMGDIK